MLLCDAPFRLALPAGEELDLENEQDLEELNDQVDSALSELATQTARALVELAIAGRDLGALRLRVELVEV